MTVRGAGPTSLGCFGVMLTISMVAFRTTLVTSHAILVRRHLCSSCIYASADVSMYRNMPKSLCLCVCCFLCLGKAKQETRANQLQRDMVGNHCVHVLVVNILEVPLQQFIKSRQCTHLHIVRMKPLFIVEVPVP